jgi:hypothetical protein
LHQLIRQETTGTADAEAVAETAADSTAMTVARQLQQLQHQPLNLQSQQLHLQHRLLLLLKEVTGNHVDA